MPQDHRIRYIVLVLVVYNINRYIHILLPPQLVICFTPWNFCLWFFTWNFIPFSIALTVFCFFCSGYFTMLIWNRIGLICPDYDQHKCPGNTPLRRPAISSRKPCDTPWCSLVHDWDPYFMAWWNTPQKNWVGFPSAIFTQITRVNWSLLNFNSASRLNSIAKASQSCFINGLEGICWRCFFFRVKHNVYRVTLLSHFGTWRCKLRKTPPNPWWFTAEAVKLFIYLHEIVFFNTLWTRGTRGGFQDINCNTWHFFIWNM